MHFVTIFYDFNFQCIYRGDTQRKFRIHLTTVIISKCHVESFADRYQAQIVIRGILGYHLKLESIVIIDWIFRWETTRHVKCTIPRARLFDIPLPSSKFPFDFEEISFLYSLFSVGVSVNFIMRASLPYFF